MIRPARGAPDWRFLGLAALALPAILLMRACDVRAQELPQQPQNLDSSANLDFLLQRLQLVEQLVNRVSGEINIQEYVILPSSDNTTAWILDVDTDGALTTASTTTAPSNFSYVSYQVTGTGSFGHRVTSDVDGALDCLSSTAKMYRPYFYLLDSSNVIWEVGLKHPGVLTTKNVGSL